MWQVDGLHGIQHRLIVVTEEAQLKKFKKWVKQEKAYGSLLKLLGWLQSMLQEVE